MKDRVITQLVHHARLIMVCNLVVLALIGWGAAGLYVESGIRIFFNEQDPNLLAQDAIEKHYGKPDNILIVLDTGDGSVFSTENLAVLEQLTIEAWQTPYSRRVDSIANYQHPSVDGDDILIEELVTDAVALSPRERARIKTIALGEQALVGRLISPNGQVAAINISLNLPADEKAAAIDQAVQWIRALTSGIDLPPGAVIHLAGWALTEQTLAEVTAADGGTLMPLLLLVVLVLLAAFLRSISASLLTLVAVVLAVVTGMGYAGWAGIGLNSVNVSAPTIIMTLAVADCVHIFNVFLNELRGGAEKNRALNKALSTTAYPIFLTSATTALGFLSMNLSESPPFRELGTISAVGVMAALWITLTILPGLILCVPFKRNGASPRLPLDWLASLVNNHRNLTFYGSLAVIVALISFTSRIELNDDPAGYFSDDVPLSNAIDVIETKLSGTQSIHYNLDSGIENGMLAPEFLGQVDAFAGWLRLQPEVVNVDVYTDTLKRLNQVMNRDEAAWHKLPDNRPLAAQYTLLYEMSVPYGLDITNRVSLDKSSMKLTVTLKNQKSQGLLLFEERSRRWLEENAPRLESRGAGQSVSFAHIGLRNISSMLYGSLLAIALISLCLAAAFRSLKYGLISLVPNLFPALTSLGIWALLVQEVNIAASVVFSLTLGIIVDDTTHFLVKFLEKRRQLNATAEQAIQYALREVGSALVITSVVLVSGFLVLVQSDFSVNSTTGLLVAITIAVAIILDLTFLPSVLLKADRWLGPGASKQTAKDSAA